MQIREVELRTGLDRANIRYYEREGLLTPERSENGYREYTEADVESLERIKLLRELDVSLEDIRRLQRGEVPLRELMERRLESLGSQAEELMRLGRLCQALCEDNVSYQTLDVGRYRQAWLLEKPPATAVLRRDVTPRMCHPWRRYFARTLDISLMTFLLTCFWFLVLGNRMDLGSSNNWLVDWLASYLSWGLLIAVEPLLLSRLGTTPGKWIFGLSLTHESGRRLTYGEAFSRLWVLFGRGYGYGIPIYSLVRLWKSSSADGRGEPLPWEEDSVYSIRDTRWFRGVSYVAVSVLIVVLSVGIGLHSMLPAHRGPLTRSEFVENFNDYCAYFTVGGHLDDSGRWVADPQSELGNYVSFVNGAKPPALTIEEKAGVVCAVSYEIEEGKAEGAIFCDGRQMVLLYFALAGAQKDVSGWDLMRTYQKLPVWRQPLLDFDREVLGLQMINKVEYEGYQASSGMMLLPQEGAGETWYRQSFSIRIPE